MGGPVWPGCGEEQSGWYDGPDHFNVEQISQDLMTQDEQDRNMSFIDKSFSCDVLNVLKTVENMETADVDVDVDDEASNQLVAKKSLPFHDVNYDLNAENFFSNPLESGPVARKSNPPTLMTAKSKCKSKTKSK